MLSCHYDQLGKHMLAHAQLKERVRSFRSAHLAGSEPAKLTADVARFLKSWLLDHILTEDMLYKDHIQKR